MKIHFRSYINNMRGNMMFKVQYTTKTTKGAMMSY